MNLRLLLGGLKSYLPIRPSAYTGTGGTTLGAYCYSVWLRHRVLIARHLPAFRPGVVVEMGPGDSVGLGLAALLSGAHEYFGLDVLQHASVATNERVLDELVRHFRARLSIPGDADFPRLLPRLESYGFPRGLLDEATLHARLDDSFVNRLRGEIRNASGARAVHYVCPWSPTSVAPASADLVISQVALQDMDHIPERSDLRRNLEAMARWLKPGGVMSHQVDFSCPGGTPWNHHWGYGSGAWTVIRGKRPYYVNRAPLSEYVRLLEAAGCEIAGIDRHAAQGLRRDQLAEPFGDLPETDLSTTAALIVAVKR